MEVRIGLRAVIVRGDSMILTFDVPPLYIGGTSEGPSNAKIIESTLNIVKILLHEVE